MAKTTQGRRKDTASKARFVQYFGPVLDALRELGGSGAPPEVVDKVAQLCKISEAVQNELTASGEPRFPKNVHWARFYLSREGLIDSSKRGIWSLTEKGQKTRLTLENATEIFRKWSSAESDRRRGRAVSAAEAQPGLEMPNQPPQDYRAEVLSRMLLLPPSGFERLAQRMLREAGFIQVTVTGKSNDGGIDGFGTLRVNRLVSLKVLFQCKRYKDTVSPAAVRDFRGAMQGRADKGIILTTGTFTEAARKEAGRDGAPQVELIDGEGLISILEDLELGLRRIATYEIDPSFFSAFEST